MVFAEWTIVDKNYWLEEVRLGFATWTLPFPYMGFLVQVFT